MGLEINRLLECLQQEGVTNEALTLAVESSALLVEFLLATPVVSCTNSIDDKVRAILNIETQSAARERQKLMREQGSLSAIMQVIALLANFVSDETDRGTEAIQLLDQDSSCPSPFASPTPRAEAELTDLIQRVRAACRVLYFLIEASLVDNTQNKLYVSQWMQTMIRHADLDIGSDKCLAAMLNNNKILLSEKVRSVCWAGNDCTDAEVGVLVWGCWDYDVDASELWGQT